MSALRPPHILLSLAALAFLWAVAIAVTGGFVTDTAFARFSSRDWRRPMIVAVAVFLVYAIKYSREWSSDLRALARLRPGVLAAICALTAFAVGVGWGTFIGGGPDASGYVSQADMWRRGTLTTSAPEWAVQAPWTDALWSSAPVGYRPRGTSPTLVPVYSPGLPLMMALFQAAGGQTAVFYVVPLLGALTVWSAFLLGRHVAGPWAGAVAALLLLSSPPFLWLLIQPMSDVAVTAWWGVALVFAWRRSDRSAALAGAATAAAILVRPNLVPLAGLVGALVAMNARANLRRLLLFGLQQHPAPSSLPR